MSCRLRRILLHNYIVENMLSIKKESKPGLAQKSLSRKSQRALPFGRLFSIRLLIHNSVTYTLSKINALKRENVLKWEKNGPVFFCLAIQSDLVVGRSSWSFHVWAVFRGTRKNKNFSEIDKNYLIYSLLALGW